MDGMKSSRNKYGLRFGATSQRGVVGRVGAIESHGYGEVTPPTKGYSGGVIVIDVSSINRRLDEADARLFLSHEIGHLGDSCGEECEQRVVDNWENPFRDRMQWPRRGAYTDPLPRLPKGNQGVRFP